MRTLVDLYGEGGESRNFVTEFVNKPHGGDWDIAKDHWTRTVKQIADADRALEAKSSREAELHAENLALHLALRLALRYKCWACGVR
ncbi:DUF6313 family protein [Streptomyces scabichelini]|uniref:DUF6313 family protein n=1 Tax=Streptomyces scabichelini TaxID=2711217 RepID=UPI003B96ED20